MLIFTLISHLPRDTAGSKVTDELLPWMWRVGKFSKNFPRPNFCLSSQNSKIMQLYHLIIQLYCMSKKILSFVNFGWKGNNFGRGNFIENYLTRHKNSNCSSCTLLLEAFLLCQYLIKRGFVFWNRIALGSNDIDQVFFVIFQIFFFFFYHSMALVKVMPLKTNLSSLFTSMGFRFAQGVIRAESMSFCESN